MDARLAMELQANEMNGNGQDDDNGNPFEVNDKFKEG
tara:strand:+ start:565 stop:675 length:111 start_codon:yes stop_codon:yes gene_type:complete